MSMVADLSLAPKTADLAALGASAEAAARLLKMLASEQRLLMLCRLVEGEAPVAELAQRAGLAQSAASQHLGKLRAVGVVATRRDAQSIYYRIADPSVVAVMTVLCSLYGADAADGSRPTDSGAR
jgi:DNA-binding transcriptional ArsR family regulator